MAEPKFRHGYLGVIVIKNFLALFLCFLFVILCSCTNNPATNITTSNESTTTAKTTQQNNTTTSTETTEEITTVNIPVTPEDPYSKFIKDKYEDFYNFQMEHDPEDFKSSVWYGAEAYYFLYDIDGNGVDELLLGDWKRITDYHDDSQAPYKILITHIYTVENGEIINLIDPTCYWWSGASYMLDRCLLSNGLIRQASENKDNPSYAYFHIQEGKLVLKCSLNVFLNEDYSNQFAYNEKNDGYDFKEITEEEYIRLRDEANGDAEVVEINWKRIDEYGR